MARKNKRDLLKNSGAQFDVQIDTPSENASIEEWDKDIYGNSDSLMEPATTDDPLLSKLPKHGLQRALQENNGQIQRKNFTLTMNGLDYTGDNLTLDEWREMGHWLTKLRDAIQWMIGDWANLGATYMESWLDEADRALIDMNTIDADGIPVGKYKWLAEVVDYKYGTLRNFAYMANKFPVSRRRDSLTYSHHIEVAKLDMTGQERLLDWAETGKDGNRVSVRDLRVAVQAELGLTAGDVRTSQRPPIYQSVSQLQQNLTTIEQEDWQQLSRDERRQIHKNIQDMLTQIERLGLD